MSRWTGPDDGDVQADGQTLKVPVPGDRWPYGPPEAHEDACGLHNEGLFCDCAASDGSVD